MLEETEEVFAFDWKIGIDQSLYNMTGVYQKISPIAKAETLKGTKWYLSLHQRNSTLPSCFTCSLCRSDDEDKSEKICVTYKLELIDTWGKILKSVVEENVTFTRRSHRNVYEFLDYDSCKLFLKTKHSEFTIRCHITDRSCKNFLTELEVPTAIYTHWKINAPGSENWSKKLKVPFHELTDINIVMQASDERINIKIVKADSLRIYEFEISVLSDQNSKIECERLKKAVENQKLETWIEKSQLIDKSRFHLPYSFTLVCIMTTSGNNSNLNAENRTLHDSFPRLKASPLPLQEDLKELLLNSKHSDVKLQTHDKIIAAHKCLLSARSPVFSTMFDQDMSETQTGVVDIPDVESETMQSFLEFLYTDIITDTDCEKVLKLMLVADKYQVDNLKERCSQLLAKKFCVKSVCYVISIAEMVNHTELKLSAMDFIRANKKEIISSSIWSKWMKENMELANEILLKMIVD